MAPQRSSRAGSISYLVFTFVPVYSATPPKMRYSDVVAAMSLATVASAVPFNMKNIHIKRQEANPWTGKKHLPNPAWAEKLEPTYETFTQAGDAVNAGKVRTIQDIGTFFWVSDRAGLSGIDDAIAAGRAAKEATGEEQIVGLVLYNLPDRDCSAGESAGELKSEEGGMEIYKNEFIKPYAEKVSQADDLTFAIVLEPDSLANLVTNTGIELCAKAAPVYEEGIAHAIANLQFPNVHLYIDAAHGGWLGWDDNLEPSAKQFAKVVELAKTQSGNNSTKIRGFSTNVSNYNPFNAEVREPYTEYSNSWDESHYASSLAPHLEAAGLPTNFIIDQGRVAAPGAREEWGEWCNVSPAGFGIKPGTTVNNTHVDSIVWIKPGGESDGECGYEGAPRAGAWFPEYVEMLVKNAHSSIAPASLAKRDEPLECEDAPVRMV
ncbi:putative exoglucanase 3 precursor protein [Paramyrothecium foliicola]|nr:putative exoglucanase 3 precursor protein [Paramyrothecium foliicola]